MSRFSANKSVNATKNTHSFRQSLVSLVENFQVVHIVNQYFVGERSVIIFNFETILVRSCSLMSYFYRTVTLRYKQGEFEVTETLRHL